MKKRDAFPLVICAAILVAFVAYAISLFVQQHQFREACDARGGHWVGTSTTLCLSPDGRILDAH